MSLCALSISVESSLRSEISKSKDMYFFILMESAKFPSKKAVSICSTNKQQFPTSLPTLGRIFFYYFLSFYWGRLSVIIVLNFHVSGFL